MVLFVTASMDPHSGSTETNTSILPIMSEADKTQEAIFACPHSHQQPPT